MNDSYLRKIIADLKEKNRQLKIHNKLLMKDNKRLRKKARVRFP